MYSAKVILQPRRPAASYLDLQIDCSLNVYAYTMRGKDEQKWRLGWESANKKSSANKLAKPYDSSKSQTVKTAPQPKRYFCSPLLPIGYGT